MNPKSMSKVEPKPFYHKMDENNFQAFGQDIFGVVIPPMPMGKPLPNDERIRFLQQEKRNHPSFKFTRPVDVSQATSMLMTGVGDEMCCRYF